MATKTRTTDKRDQRAPAKTPINSELLKDLYLNMLKCRRISERAQARFAERGGARFPALGHEATLVGATINLAPEDALAASPENLVATVMKGEEPRRVLRMLSPGDAHLAGHRIIAPAATVSTQLRVAAGVAMAYKMQKLANIVVALAGGQSSAHFAWQEVVAYAGEHKLPIVYVVENDPGMDSGGQVYGVPVIRVDGNDVIAVYRVCYEAREHARRGYGPTLVECNTHRWYVSGEDARDPIPALERHLRKKGLWDDQWKADLEGELAQSLA